jgi:hypothetical protein
MSTPMSAFPMLALRRSLRRSLLVELALAASFISCTVIEVDSRRSPAGVQADGLIDGHLAFGMSGETQPLRIQVLDGSSKGAVFELVVWKLLRFEIGLAGLDIGIGPVDAGLGVLFYDPSLPPQPPRETEPEPKAAPAPPAAPAPAPAPSDAGATPEG